MDYFHYCNAKDSDDERSMQTTQDGDKGKKENTPCHPSLDEALKFTKEHHVAMCEYVKNNPKHFCKTCGLNLKYTHYLVASYQYEALVLSEDDCKICESPKGKICDVDKHQEYHREICLK